MGSKVFQTLKNKDGYHIVALIDHKPEKWNEKKLSVPVFADIQSCFLETKPDVLIDFTNPTASYQFIKIAIEHQVKVIRDRKSTRLNSSHVAISYAVFCFKKKIDYIAGVKLNNRHLRTLQRGRYHLDKDNELI